jgi:hypothetical protein
MIASNDHHIEVTIAVDGLCSIRFGLGICKFRKIIRTSSSAIQIKFKFKLNKFQIQNKKIQNKFKNSNPKTQTVCFFFVFWILIFVWNLEFGAWNLFGIWSWEFVWNLELGICLEFGAWNLELGI